MTKCFLLFACLLASIVCSGSESDTLQRPPVKGALKVSGTMTAQKTGRLYIWNRSAAMWQNWIARKSRMDSLHSLNVISNWVFT